MSRATPILTSFNAGEFSPLLAGRLDLQKYSSACRLTQNFIPTIQGPGTRRAGTRMVQSAKSPAQRAWLLPFEFSASQAFILEFGDQYIRFYAQHGQLEIDPDPPLWTNLANYAVGDLVIRGIGFYYAIVDNSGADPLTNPDKWYTEPGVFYEIPSPYLVADLTNADGSCALSFEQLGDVLYIANAYRTYATRKLTRFGNNKWILTEYDSQTGPFGDLNETATTIYANASTGSVTLTASAPAFVATDIGRLVRLEVENINVQPWTDGKGYSINDLARFDGKTYKALNNATSGTSPPTHEHGTAFDGKGGVQWEYQDAGYGVAKITAYTSTTVVTASVVVDTPNGLKQLPTDVVGAPQASTRWKLGMWSATTEYPALVVLWRDRFWLFGKRNYSGSVPNDFENQAMDFFGEQRTDSAIVGSIQAQDVNDITWAVGTDRLLIGTGGGEFVGAEITNTLPLGPNNFKTTRQSKRRSRSVRPPIVGNTIVYVQRAGRKMFALNYAFETDNYKSLDVTALANRLTRFGIVQLAYQAEPQSVIWAISSTGALYAFTYDPEQDVLGWARQSIGGNGIVESIACIPAPDGSRDELWMIVRRTINGATARYIEFLEKPWEGEDNDGSGADDLSLMFYVDSGLTYSGAPATTISGLSHLEGQTVQVLADSASHPDCVVSGGQIELDRQASIAHVGLACPARLVTMSLEGGSQTGTSQGKTRRVDSAVVRFVDTLGGSIGMFNGTLDDLSLRSPSTPMGQAPAPVSIDHEIKDFPGDYALDCAIEIRQDQPFPMTIAAIMPRFKAYDT